jgi:hypothetical protein
MSGCHLGRPFRPGGRYRAGTGERTAKPRRRQNGSHQCVALSFTSRGRYNTLWFVERLQCRESTIELTTYHFLLWVYVVHPPT